MTAASQARQEKTCALLAEPFGMNEATKLSDLELAEALWETSAAAEDSYNETAICAISILIGEALERWAPDVELAAIEKQMREDEPPTGWQNELRAHREGCEERRALRAAAQAGSAN